MPIIIQLYRWTQLLQVVPFNLAHPAYTSTFEAFDSGRSGLESGREHILSADTASPLQL